MPSSPVLVMCLSDCLFTFVKLLALCPAVLSTEYNRFVLLVFICKLMSNLNPEKQYFTPQGQKQQKLIQCFRERDFSRVPPLQPWML